VQGDTAYDADADEEGRTTVVSFPVEAATIVHECAHVLADLHDDHDDDHHGEHFRNWHLRLVRDGYGDDAADLLAELYERLLE